MKYLRIFLLASIVLATAGCDELNDRINYYFNSGASLRQDTSPSEDGSSDGATFVISSVP